MTEIGIQTFWALDPLEQFEVVSLYNFGLPAITNLSATLLIILAFLSILLYFFNNETYTNYDFMLISGYALVKGIVENNLYIKKQIYFPILFFLFFVILLCNLIGLTPYAFTVTSSFMFTFYLALTYFIGINIIGIFLSQWKATN